MGDDPPARLDDGALHAGVALLIARDTDLAGIVARHGPPPLWAREPGFATLVHIILEQQVSLRSAEAAMGRPLASADDGTARRQLLGFVGIGPWTADIYLLMALGRPDIWPVGDLALATAMRRAKRLAAVPRSDEQLAMAEAWRPLRAVAARVLWHAYLAGER